jgi:hypothetical protein
VRSDAVQLPGRREKEAVLWTQIILSVALGVLLFCLACSIFILLRLRKMIWKGRLSGQSIRPEYLISYGANPR